ncbi:MAG: glycosyltransferase [Bacteroidota bacterium]
MYNTNFNILFVSSGNSSLGISPIVGNQVNSLLLHNCRVNNYLIKGKGILGYLRNVLQLRKHLQTNSYDIIHAHYSFSGFVASLAGARPLIVSLMGSDVNNSYLSRFLVKVFIVLFKWRAIIVKSDKMIYDFNNFCMVYVIPNGVNMDVFFPRNRNDCCKILEWNPNLIHVLFAADPQRKEKNFLLASSAFASLNVKNAVLHTLKNVPHDNVPLWFNASDVVILSSLSEGSPNVIKEAMACNRPIVSTDVGDVKLLFDHEPGHFISGFSNDDYRNNLEKAILFSQSNYSTMGRNRLIELGLDHSAIANKIINVYNNVLKLVH